VALGVRDCRRFLSCYCRPSWNPSQYPFRLGLAFLDIPVRRNPHSWSSRRISVAPKELSNRLEQKVGSLWHLVKLTLSTKEGLLGTDDGIVGIENGILKYEGLRTKFEIGSGDVVVPPDSFADGPLMRQEGRKWLYGNEPERIAWGFDLKVRPDVHLYFFPLNRTTAPIMFGAIKSVGREFYSSVYEWLKSSDSLVRERVLPPVEPMPGVIYPPVKRKLGERILHFFFA